VAKNLDLAIGFVFRRQNQWREHYLPAHSRLAPHRHWFRFALFFMSSSLVALSPALLAVGVDLCLACHGAASESDDAGTDYEMRDQPLP
jgi:hypothetical protein